MCDGTDTPTPLLSSPVIINGGSIIISGRTFAKMLIFTLPDKSLPTPGPDTKLWGMPQSRMAPEEPPWGDEIFRWQETECCTAPPPTALRLEPPPPVSPPEHHWHPYSGVFTLNEQIDYRYKRGWFYYIAYDPSDRMLLRQQFMRLTTPPNLARPKSFNDSVPGMIRIPVNVPFVNFLRGNPNHALTVACFQTLDSLDTYPGVGSRVRGLASVLHKITWGSQDGKQPPIYSFDLKLNDRAPTNLPPDSHDGSFNLAATVMEGDGRGIFLPAMQNCTPEASASIKQALKCLAELTRLIIPCCVSKFEIEMVDFNSIDNNIFVFGGITSLATGCQMNVASLTDDLRLSIGADSAFWHPDTKDDGRRWTLVTLVLRIPPGIYSPGFDAYSASHSRIRCRPRCLRIGSAWLVYKGAGAVHPLSALSTLR